jgi:hypothetical protein
VAVPVTVCACSPDIVWRILSRSTLRNKAGAHAPEFSTTICAVRQTSHFAVMLAALLIASCSGLSTLTPAMLDDAEAKWKKAKPSSYRLIVAMEGDRVEREEFDVQVEGGAVTALKRNGEAVSLRVGEDHSMEGLFRIVRQEIDLAKNPVLLGAQPGYSVYLMARFDSRTGGLIHFRRSVGGISNSIDIEVLKFETSGSGK